MKVRLGQSIATLVASMALAIGCVPGMSVGVGLNLTPRSEVEVVDDGPPPPKEIENPGARAGHVWVRGHWVLVGGGWSWVRGRWEPAQPGYVFIQPHWQRAQDGSWFFVAGHWVSEAQMAGARSAAPPPQSGASPSSAPQAQQAPPAPPPNLPPPQTQGTGKPAELGTDHHEHAHAHPHGGSDHHHHEHAHPHPAGSKHHHPV